MQADGPTETTLSNEVLLRLRPVRLLCLDVDGVLSDGYLYYNGGEGDETWSQRFSVRDGVGLKLLMQDGVSVAILSEGGIKSAQVRAAGLGIERAYFRLKDKVATFHALCAELAVAAEEAAFIGDELADIALLKTVGLGCTVPDAVDEVKEAAHYVTRRPGGGGAVREVADLIRKYRAR